MFILIILLLIIPTIQGPIMESELHIEDHTHEIIMYYNLYQK
jgi:hypothetical protein